MTSIRASRPTDSRTTRADVITTTTADDELLPIGEIKKIAGIGKTMIYRLEREGSFPKRYKPGGYASRWSRREVMAWREDQRAARASLPRCHSTIVSVQCHPGQVDIFDRHGHAAPVNRGLRGN